MMTERQLVYLELCKNGYGVDEIASLTNRHPNTVINTLKLAVDRECRTPQACAVCPLEITCNANYERVQRLIRRWRCRL